MAVTSVEKADGVAVLRMENGKANPIGNALITELALRLYGLSADAEVMGLVLAGNGKFFSIGLDLPELVGLERPAFEKFFHNFNNLCIALYTFPKPTAAAIEGHATAGGCILALCCDFRFMAPGKKMGLNESKLGVPVPRLAELILEQLAGEEAAARTIEAGDFYEGEGLLDRTMVDAITDDPMARAASKVGEMAKAPREDFDSFMSKYKGSVMSRFAAEREARERAFVDAWFSPEARKLLEEANAKFRPEK